MLPFVAALSFSYVASWYPYPTQYRFWPNQYGHPDEKWVEKLVRPLYDPYVLADDQRRNDVLVRIWDSQPTPNDPQYPGRQSLARHLCRFVLLRWPVGIQPENRIYDRIKYSPRTAWPVSDILRVLDTAAVPGIVDEIGLTDPASEAGRSQREVLGLTLTWIYRPEYGKYRFGRELAAERVRLEANDPRTSSAARARLLEALNHFPLRPEPASRPPGTGK